MAIILNFFNYQKDNIIFKISYNVYYVNFSEAKRSFQSVIIQKPIQSFNSLG